MAEALVRQRAILADEEACCRAAISRAYYAAYGAARNHARRRGTRPQPDGDDHRQVLLHYRHAADVAHQELGELLFRLRRHRTQADYADTLLDVVPRAYAALRRARRVFTLLQAL